MIKEGQIPKQLTNVRENSNKPMYEEGTTSKEEYGNKFLSNGEKEEDQSSLKSESKFQSREGI